MAFSFVEVLEEFAERAASRFLNEGPRDEFDWFFQPTESFRRSYRTRNRAEGRCRSCPRPAEPNRASCSVHLEKANARARASQARREVA